VASKTSQTKAQADQHGWIWVIVIPAVALLAAAGIFGLCTGVFAGLPISVGQVASATPSPTPGEATYVLKGHAGSVDAVAFSPDGATLASAGGADDGRMKLWRVVDGSLIYSIDVNVGATPGGTHGLAFSPDGKIVAAAGCKSRDTVLSFSVAFSPDGTMVASGSLDMTVPVWAVPSSSLPRK
jgi:WD40 repeat protein